MPFNPYSTDQFFLCLSLVFQMANTVLFQRTEFDGIPPYASELPTRNKTEVS